MTIRKLKEELPTGLAGQLEWPKTLRREFEQPVLESKLTAHIQNNLKSFRRLLKYAQDNKASEADFLLCDQTALAIESKDNLSKANDTIYLLWRAKGIVEFGVAASLQTFAAEEDPGCNWLVRAFEEIGCNDCARDAKAASKLNEDTPEDDVQELNRILWKAGRGRLVTNLAKYIRTHESGE